MNLKLIACAAGLGLAGCFSNDIGPGPSETQGPGETRRPGQIRLVAANGLAKAAQTQTGVFDLDTARTSFQQYFILQNTGDFDITDIDLTTDDPNFTFSPSHISVLPPTAGSSLIQVIKLNVTHGKRLDGLGFGNFLTPGLNEVEALVTGTTVDEDDDTLAVNEGATLRTFAKVASLSVSGGGSGYSLIGLLYGTTHNDVGTNIRHYSVPIDSVANPGRLVSVKNTGSVALTVRRWNANTQAPLGTVTLAVDSSLTFTSAILEFDAHGTTFAPAELPVGGDGKLLIILYPR